MIENNVRSHGTSPATSVTSTPDARPAGETATRESSTRGSSPLASGRNAGGSSTAGRVSLSALPGKALQRLMGHVDPATRQALALSGRALAAHAAIQAANTAEGFKRASIHLEAMAGSERHEALRALCDCLAAKLERLDLADILPSQATVTAAMEQLPVAAGSLATVFDTGRSMFKAVARSIDYQVHAPADKAALRDQLAMGVSVSLKALTTSLRKHGGVHDEKGMNEVAEQLMGPGTSPLSAQVAFSELPQHALDLPATKEGDGQAVRLLTSIAERAVRDGGLDALRSDPSWASFLENDRIGVVLDRRGMDLADHPELQAALTRLKQKAEELA